MNREILFRGKRIDNGEWVEGFIYQHEPPIQCIVPDDYIPEKSKWYICKTAFADWNMPRQVEFAEVNLDTVGQYTGLTDKNGKKIFEGDIIELVNEDGETIRVICEFGTARRTMYGKEVDITGFYFLIPDINRKSFPIVHNYLGKHDLEIFEIVGNLHDNPELLEDTK